MDSPNLNGYAVLVVEDEPFIASHLVSTLSKAGAKAESATNLANTLQYTEKMNFNAAIVDVRLRGGDCRSVCEHLSKCGIPFLFYTGYSKSDIPDEWPDAPVITKPATDKQIVHAILSLAGPSSPDDKASTV